MTLTEKRKQIEEVIYTTMKLLDPSGYNEAKYRTIFKEMNDNQFSNYMKKLFSDEDNNLTLETTPFQKNHTDLKIEDIKKAADYLNIPLDEYIYMPFMNPGGKVVRSKYPTPVGYVHIKRLEQILSKKNAYSSDITERNSKTGQVTGHDKNGRISDMENYALLTLGANEALKEFLGPRADDMVMKQDMLKDIARDGYTSLKNMTNDIENKTALNTLDMYYTAAGLVTNLVTPGLVLKRNLQNKEKKERMQERYTK